MADKDYKAFIVEGEAREPQVIDNISKVFFKHGNFKVITFPAGAKRRPNLRLDFGPRYTKRHGA